MPQAVRFDQYGGPDVLYVVDVEPPEPGEGEVVVRVKAAGINPGEAVIREGLLHERWPATFPSGQGSDLAGVIAEVGAGVEGFGVGDEVIGFTHDRASQAELVVVDAQNVTPRPSAVSWEAAGALFVAGTTAYAVVRAVAPAEGDVLAVSGAAGGVGTLAVQLARNAGATSNPCRVASSVAARGVVVVEGAPGLGKTSLVRHGPPSDPTTAWNTSSTSTGPTTSMCSSTSPCSTAPWSSRARSDRFPRECLPCGMSRSASLRHDGLPRAQSWPGRAHDRPARREPARR